jgi:hypothetical protein
MLRFSSVLAAFFALLISAEPGLDRALSLYDAGRLSEALDELEDTLRRGNLSPPDLAQLYRHLGILRAGSRDAGGAEQAFLALLSIDPHVELAKDQSPVIVEPFTRAKKRLSNGTGIVLKLSGSREIDAGTRYAAVVEIEGDAANLVKAARARIGQEAVEIDARGPPPIKLAFPEATTERERALRYEVELIDAYGSIVRATEGEVNIVAVAPAMAVPVFVPAKPELVSPPTPIAAESSLLESPWFWGGVGAAAITGAVVIIAIVASPGSGQARFSPVEVVER